MAEEYNKEERKDDNVYFAADDPEETVSTLYQKAGNWFDDLVSNGYLDKIRDSWLAYHGATYDDSGHKLSFSGEQGELVNLKVNHYRNIGQHILNMVTSTRPAFQARSTNTDYKSLVQTKLANGLLDYYMREKRMERYLKTAVEYAVVFGSGYMKMEWNATSGEMIDFNEELEVPIYAGDVEFSNLSPYDVVFDSTKDGPHFDWLICRTFKNKYDIAAKYPEYKEKILGLKTKSDINKQMLVGRAYDETVDVPVFEFFHNRTESMPDGRYLLYLEDDIVLMDSPLPYREIPVYRISPSEILGTPYGYTSMFDLLPLQEAINMLYSTALTNQNAFGVQNIYVPRGADIAINQFSSGLNVIEGNHQAGKPEPLQLTSTPAEIFNFMQQLVHDMETISGVNSVARGNPEASLKSGNALALIQSQALQFISGLQQQYIQTIEDAGTGLINLLKDFASAPRIAAIVGKSNRTEMKEFIGEDLNSINRVVVDVGNALSTTTAGRVQMADNLLQMGAITSADQYLAVMNTGKLEVMTEGANSQLMLIKSENERLVDGEVHIMAIATENHALHIKEHQYVISDPDLKQDQELVQRTLDHINQHLTLLRETDPDLLAMLGQQPLGPVGGSPVNPNNVPQNQGQPQGGPAGGPMNNPEAAGVQVQTGQLPQPAEPTPVDDPRPLKG